MGIKFVRGKGRAKPLKPPGVVPDPVVVRRLLKNEPMPAGALVKLLVEHDGRYYTKASVRRCMMDVMKGDVAFTVKRGCTLFYLTAPRLIKRHTCPIAWYVDQMLGDFTPLIEVADGNDTRGASKNKDKEPANNPWRLLA